MSCFKVFACLMLLLLVGGCEGTNRGVNELPQPGPKPEMANNADDKTAGEPETIVMPATTLPQSTGKQDVEDRGTYDFRVLGMKDYGEYLAEIYNIIEFYAGLDFQRKGELAYEFPLTEEERERTLEIIGYTEEEYRQLTAETISRDELEWYVDIGAIEVDAGRLKEGSYTLVRKGEYGHIPYVVIDGTEHCLITEEPDEYDAVMHEQYFQEIQYDLVNITYSADLNRVTAVVTSSLGATYEIRMNFNQEGMISRIDRMML